MKRVFFDLETSPNIMFSWRCGSKIRLDYHNIIRERAIICACYKWEGDDDVKVSTWNNGDDRRVCEELGEVLARADECVSHNGDRFDIPWLNTRNLMHGLPAIPPANNVDTLKWARRYFYLNSGRLDYLGKILLGEQKIKTNFDLWKRIVLANDPQALDEMVTYCKQDVRLLEKIWTKLRDYAPAKTHAGVAHTHDRSLRWTCPHCASTDVIVTKTRSTAKGMVQKQMKCKECKRYYSVAENVAKARDKWMLANSPTG